ncbi:hypothetical protein BLNAU_24996 [Blattamonas nauphoetae]|uniref:Uncharacterized protein n=1 Tax=Blattamonas nauphoetae TaxID=2049346 RepID=A0ABQ9WKU5_9EUKA|nr:hypothetical protein BLNAU_24996 [Blattamonas nauphoetae]
MGNGERNRTPTLHQIQPTTLANPQPTIVPLPSLSTSEPTVTAPTVEKRFVPRIKTGSHHPKLATAHLHDLSTPKYVFHPNKDPNSQHHIARKTLLTLNCKSPLHSSHLFLVSSKHNILAASKKYPSTISILHPVNAHNFNALRTPIDVAVVDQTETLLSSQQWCRFYQEVLTSIEGQDKDGRGTRADMVILAARVGMSAESVSLLSLTLQLSFAEIWPKFVKDLLRQFGNLLTASTAFEICLHPFGTHCIQAMIVRAGGNTDLEAQLGRHLYGHAFRVSSDKTGIHVILCIPLSKTRSQIDVCFQNHCEVQCYRAAVEILEGTGSDYAKVKTDFPVYKA